MTGTILHPVNVCDRLTFERDAHGVQTHMRQRDVADGRTKSRSPRDNWFLQAAKITDGVRIHLEKKFRLPPAWRWQRKRRRDTARVE